MIKIFILVIASLELALGQEFLTYIQTGDHSIQSFKCLLSQKAVKGAPLPMLSVENNSYKWIGLEPNIAYTIYPQLSHVLLSYSTQNDQAKFADTISKALKDQKIKTVWLMAFTETIRSCEQLKSKINILGKILRKDQNIGVFTWVQGWDNIFGTEGCQQVTKIVPLFSSLEQGPFSPFGGWTRAQYMMEYQINVPKCKIENQDSYVTYSAKQ